MARSVGGGDGEDSDATSRELGAYTALALMVLIGSSTATSAKFAVRELPVAFLPLVRFGIAGLCLVMLVGGFGKLRHLLHENPGRLLLAGALCVPINQAFFLYGTKLAPTSHVGLIYATCPLVVLLIASALGQERLAWRRFWGVAVSVSGVLVIGLESLWHGGAGPAGTFWGDVLLVGAVVSWSAYLTVNKPLVSRHGAVPVLAGTFLVGSVLNLPLVLASIPRWPTALPAASPAAWWGLAHLTLIVSVIGLACQNQALRRLDASQVATVGNLAPILTVVWGVLLLGEALSPALIVGGALTLGGVLWTSRPRGRRFGPRPKSEPVAEASPSGDVWVSRSALASPTES